MSNICIGIDVAHYGGDRGQKSRDNREDLLGYCLAGLPFLSLIVRPCGDGFLISLVWDEKTQRFSGYDDINGK